MAEHRSFHFRWWWGDSDEQRAQEDPEFARELAEKKEAAAEALGKDVSEVEKLDAEDARQEVEAALARGDSETADKLLAVARPPESAERPERPESVAKAREIREAGEAKEAAAAETDGAADVPAAADGQRRGSSWWPWGGESVTEESVPESLAQDKLKAEKREEAEQTVEAAKRRPAEPQVLQEERNAVHSEKRSGEPPGSEKGVASSLQGRSLQTTPLKSVSASQRAVSDRAGDQRGVHAAAKTGASAGRDSVLSKGAESLAAANPSVYREDLQKDIKNSQSLQKDISGSLDNAGAKNRSQEELEARLSAAAEAGALAGARAAVAAQLAKEQKTHPLSTEQNGVDGCGPEQSQAGSAAENTAEGTAETTSFFARAAAATRSGLLRAASAVLPARADGTAEVEAKEGADGNAVAGEGGDPTGSAQIAHAVRSGNAAAAADSSEIAAQISAALDKDSGNDTRVYLIYLGLLNIAVIALFLLFTEYLADCSVRFQPFALFFLVIGLVPFILAPWHRRAGILRVALGTCAAVVLILLWLFWWRARVYFYSIDVVGTTASMEPIMSQAPEVADASIAKLQTADGRRVGDVIAELKKRYGVKVFLLNYDLPQSVGASLFEPCIAIELLKEHLGEKQATADTMLPPFFSADWGTEDAHRALESIGRFRFTEFAPAYVVTLGLVELDEEGRRRLNRRVEDGLALVKPSA